MSILLHVTLRRNIPSIYRNGINPAFSRTQWRVCWFCPRSRRAWAIAHVAERHGVDPSEVVVLRVSLPRDQLVKRGRCMWTCAKVVRSIVSVSLPFAA